ncbi:heme-binding protein [soil metagenome]
MRIKILPLLAAACAGVGIFAIANDALAKYEEPTYAILEKDGDFEIRDYPSVIAAEVEVSGSGESAANEAFKIIGGYIFGKNVSKTKVAMTVPVTEKISSEKIAMTVPVTTDKQKNSMTMRFYMPSSYTLETLPEPIDKRIKLFTLPKARYAVIRFSGFANEKNCAHHEDLLDNFVKSKNLDASETPVRAFYNPPWALPFMRRNEIWQKVSSADNT